MRVIPAILEENPREIQRKIEELALVSKAFHIDFIDNKFSENPTVLEHSVFSQLPKDLFLEAHLMVDQPINYIEGLSKAGFKRFIGQVEHMKDQEEFVARAQLLGEVGLGLDLDTLVSSIKVPFDDLDLILIMCVKAGKSGQGFQEQALGKVEALKGKIKVEVDGGINESSIIRTKEAGAQFFCANSFIFSSDNPVKQYERLDTALKSSQGQTV